jgi:hypothetical protein
MPDVARSSERHHRRTSPPYFSLFTRQSTIHVFALYLSPITPLPVVLDTSLSQWAALVAADPLPSPLLAATTSRTAQARKRPGHRSSLLLLQGPAVAGLIQCWDFTGIGECVGHHGQYVYTSININTCSRSNLYTGSHTSLVSGSATAGHPTTLVASHPTDGMRSVTLEATIRVFAINTVLVFGNRAEHQARYIVYSLTHSLLCCYQYLCL